MRRKGMFMKGTAVTILCCMLAGTAIPITSMKEVHAEELGDTRGNEIQSVVSRYYGEWKDTSYPGWSSNTMPNTALLGNGDVGITSGGNDTSKTFYVSKGDFWAYKDRPLPIGGVTINEEQKVIEETEVNLAPTNSGVTASSVLADFKAEKAVDGTVNVGDANDMWCTQRPQDAGQNGKKEFWLKLEFEDPITFARYVVKSDAAVRPGVPGIEANTTSDFQLQISDTGDDDSWVDIDSVSGNKMAEFDKNLEQPQTAKFVRLYITKATQETTADTRNNPRARIAQFELYEEPSEDIGNEQSNNLALNKPALVSSTYKADTPGENLVDGDTTTRWVTSLDNVNDAEHWAVIDLGESKEIRSWKIQSQPDNNYITSDFKLQWSDNGEDSWNDFVDVQNNSNVIMKENLEEPVNAQFVRLLVTKGSQNDNMHARIMELELYSENITPFYEKQDILNAEIQTTQKMLNTPTEMRTWLASDQNIMVTELTSNSSEDAAFQVETWALNNEKAKKPITALNDDNSVTVTRRTENKYPNDSESWTSQAALATKVIGADDVVASSDNENGKGKLKFTLKAGETIQIVTAIGGGGRTYHNDGSPWEGQDSISSAAELLNNVPDGIAVTELDYARKAWWTEFWSASYVDFGTGDEKLNILQKYYYGAQYILGSAAREGKIAPGLYGIWHTTDSAQWYSDYHMNYNFMATFYGTYSSNRPEFSLPATEALYAYAPAGERNAASVEELKKVDKSEGKSFVENKIKKGDIDREKGIEGALLFPVGINPWGTTPYSGVYHNELLDAAYNTHLMTEYYQYTLDEEFAVEMYDFLKKTAKLYEAWLEKEDGRYVLYAGYCEGTWAKNPAVELAAAYNVFNNLVMLSEKLELDADKRELWKNIRDDMGVMPTTDYNGKTVYNLAEANADGSKLNFRLDYSNVVMLDTFMPGGRLGYYSDPGELQIARDTIDAFGNSAWTNMNNFPRIYPDAVRARYNIDDVVTRLTNQIQSQMVANLRIYDGYHGVEKSGSTEAVNSMMLISDEGITKIFPNWYADKDAKFSTLRTNGAFTVSAEYDGTAQEAKNIVVTSEKGETMTLVSPWGEGATVRDSAGNIVNTTAGTVPNWEDEKTITFATTAGETYTVEKGETPVEPTSKTTLEKFLNKAKQHVENGDVDGLVESVKNLFDEAIAEGDAVMAKEDASKEEILNASLKLMKAIHALNMKAGDKADLGMALELAAMIDLTKYVEAGQVEYLAAKAEAERVMGDGDVMQPEVDTAWETLADTMMNLRLKADKASLADLIESVKQIELSKYTDESVKVFNDALAKANAVMGDETLSVEQQSEVDKTVKLLADAKDGLTEKKGSGGDQNGEDQNNGGSNGGNQGNGNQGNGNQGNGNQNDNKQPVKQTVKTGDASAFFLPILGILLSFGGTLAIGAFAVRKRRR